VTDQPPHLSFGWRTPSPPKGARASTSAGMRPRVALTFGSACTMPTLRIAQGRLWRSALQIYG